MSDNGVIELIIFLLAVFLAAQTFRAWFYRKALLHQRKQHELIIKIKDGTIDALVFADARRFQSNFTLAAGRLGPDEWPDSID